MVFFNRKKAAEISELEQFLNNESGNLEESISKGLVEIMDHGTHHSNGLLLTTNGYFITANHCVRNLPESIKLYNGNEYAITKVCAIGKKEDIAIVKADITDKCSPFCYKFNNKIQQKDVIALLTRRDGKLNYKYGFIFSEYNIAKTRTKEGKLYQYPNQFMVRIEGKPGDSGGLILNKDKMILGLVSGGHSDNILDITAIVRIEKALKLISFYKETLEKEM